MDYFLPSSIGVIILFLIIRFLIKNNEEMARDENVIKGRDFIIREQTPEEKQKEQIWNLVEQAKKTEDAIKKIGDR
jgi:hypothetical protein